VLDGVMEAIGLGGEENAGTAADRAARHRQARQVRPRGRALLLGEGRKDESGDFTKGAGLERGADRCSTFLGTVSLDANIADRTRLSRTGEFKRKFLVQRSCDRFWLSRLGSEQSSRQN
jgi:hypothetical protein